MEPPRKRLRTLANDHQMELLGSKGLLKKSEFVRLITDALYSLGYYKNGALLEEESRIPLHSPIAELFLKQVKNAEWDESIATLHKFELKDEKAVAFLLLEQKFFDFLKMKNVKDALKILREKMEPLGVNTKRVHELEFQVITDSSKDPESVNSRSKILEKLKNLLPPAFLIPQRRLEHLLEGTLDIQRLCCFFHNIPDSDLSLCSYHECGYHRIPSESVQSLEKHTDEVWFVKFSHNGKCLASSSKDKSAIIWEMDAEGKFSWKYKLEGHEKPVVMVLWSPDDRQVITCGEDEVIKRWDVESGQLLQSYEENGVGSVSCGWFHDGSGVIGRMADRNIFLWNLDGTEQEHKLGKRVKNLTDVAMTTDGKWLVSMGTEHEILFFDRETWRVKKVISEKDKIASFSLSKDSKHILINLSRKDMISLWSIEGDDEPYKYNEYIGHKNSRFIIRSCFGGYEENFIASGSEDYLVYIWHRASAESPIRKLRGHTGAVKCVSWNPTDLHMLASASDDGTIRIWGLDQKQKLKSVYGNKDDDDDLEV